MIRSFLFLSFVGAATAQGRILLGAKLALAFGVLIFPTGPLPKSGLRQKSLLHLSKRLPPGRTLRLDPRGNGG